MSALDLLPNRRVEGWRWSDLRAAVGSQLPPIASRPERVPPEHDLWSQLGAEIIFADGRIACWPEEEVSGIRVFSKTASEAGPPRSSPNVAVGQFAADSIEDDWFPIVGSTAQHGVVVVRHVGGSTPQMRAARLGVQVGAGESLTLIEVFENELAGVTNTLMECYVEPGGRLNRLVVQPQTEPATIVCTGQAFLGEKSEFNQFVFSAGGKLSRIQTDVIAGAGAKARLNGVCLAAAGLHADQTSHVTLEAEGGEVRQLVRSVARRKGRAVFQGKFLVERTAQKTDAQMEHNALLLEDGAEVFAKPELEIYADDVQCSHGNTCGQLDEQAVFYARSRGLPEAEARAMLTRAFLIEAIPDWLDEALHAEIEARVSAWLEAG
ncbi:MAG: SufD family Fe-S cluster assembly protein [Hyphomonadaceae bacterium]